MKTLNEVIEMVDNNKEAFLIVFYYKSNKELKTLLDSKSISTNSLVNAYKITKSKKLKSLISEELDRRNKEAEYQLNTISKLEFAIKKARTDNFASENTRNIILEVLNFNKIYEYNGIYDVHQDIFLSKNTIKLYDAILKNDENNFINLFIYKEAISILGQKNKPIELRVKLIKDLKLSTQERIKLLKENEKSLLDVLINENNIRAFKQNLRSFIFENNYRIILNSNSGSKLIEKHENYLSSFFTNPEDAGKWVIFLAHIKENTSLYKRIYNKISFKTSSFSDWRFIYSFTKSFKIKSEILEKMKSLRSDFFSNLEYFEILCRKELYKEKKDRKLFKKIKSTDFPEKRYDYLDLFYSCANLIQGENLRFEKLEDLLKKYNRKSYLEILRSNFTPHSN